MHYRASSSSYSGICRRVIGDPWAPAGGWEGALAPENVVKCFCAARSRLRSAARGDLQVPRSKTNFGSRAFAVAGPMFWNRLPPEIRANDSLQSFKSQLGILFLTLITSSAGALELDSMLWRLRSQRVIIIIIIIIISFTVHLTYTQYQKIASNVFLYTVSHTKTCHFVFDYNSGVSWATFTIFKPRTGNNNQYSTVY